MAAAARSKSIGRMAVFMPALHNARLNLKYIDNDTRS
jgi:hypothetical protein